ncbi:malto-oligosyltrehalose synthase [Sphingosinicella sp. CPCC 101087]|uniref:malto-oligosyltrehalose synthase n=1 Tax=Sphingosinicella sp. CPCC 101087 TaxID=2497754 RepID=UPI00101D7AA5|nr:malto-oligosyltrehalose synthase [Sphingosinicella sp. CPCC 101087]
MRPRATYRLQFNSAFTFDQAEAIVPYLRDLGISHVYASPVTAAQAGSTHGYDVIDPTRINPELGGEAGFRRLAGRLRAEGMGLILDIVPNHMSVTGGANSWWNDLLAKGRASAFADYFDVDWSDKILLPFLGAPPEVAIAAGDLRLERHEGRLWILAHGADLYPLRDEDQSGGDLAALLERQHYRLAWWRAANDLLNWRRFFTITGLAGVRVEDEAVFEATHALYFRLHSEGLIDGVRVDHVDGLADPAAYCRRLRSRLGADAWILVEKILGPGESLREEWGVDGTSGYDFMEQVAALLHDPAGEAPLARHWSQVSSRALDAGGEELLARRQILAWEFEGQLAACVEAFAAVADCSDETRAFTKPSLRRAIEALLQAFPVYRGYGDAADAPLLADVRGRALPLAPPGEADVLDRLLAWLAPDVPDDTPGADPAPPARLADARRRFRQLSAPIAAKAVEDTAFYRYGRLLSRNDVGFDPRRFSMDVESFQAAMAGRGERWPGAMLATATHDHKRGEDVRARLAVLSELAEEWITAAESWRRANGAAQSGIDPGDEYMLYQMLVGAWPAALAIEEADSCAAFRERLWAWMEKALREAKLRSSWTQPNESYEGRCRGFVERLLDPTRSAAFLDEARAFVGRIAPAAEANSLVQVFLRCAAPGVPDCYQGCEFADFSMVDPDNRRPVDYTARAEALGAAEPHGFDAAKQRLIAQMLGARRAHADLWSEGSWEPVGVEGPRAEHMLAFIRRRGESGLLGAAALRCAPALAGTGHRAPPADFWENTRLAAAGEPRVADLFETLPVHLSRIERGALKPVVR